jgi:RNA polymerase sigma-70 factor (ECF subfamily)
MTINFNENEQRETGQLVRLAQQGDRQAFGELFERFERTVFAIALRRMRDFNEAQELTQDVFVQAMTKLDQLREPECFAGWLRSITHRMAINRMVRRGPAIPTEPEAMEANCVETVTPLANALTAERKSKVKGGLVGLDELHRETLEAFYFKGKSLKEMSAEFEAPIGTIKRRLFEGRRRLGRKLEPFVAV